MARFVGGDVVVVPFPFTDLSSAKVRPALALAAFSRGDLILCQITSQATGCIDLWSLANGACRPSQGRERGVIAVSRSNQEADDAPRP